MENQVQTKTIPEGVKQWNWGAFMFSIFWGFGNRTYWPLLCIIPLFNFIWMFVCGIKGNEWAWRNGNYSDVTFKLVQDTWNRAGLAAFIISLIFIILYFLFFSVFAIFLFYQSRLRTSSSGINYYLNA
ncbi:MAG: ribonuclease G [Candidatus Arsenophonus phytopathogenicus]